MTRKLELKSRVARLLDGDFRPDDLTHLFLFLREHNNGFSFIKEFGDFIAHSDERLKGPTTDEVRDFFTHLRLMLPYMEGKVDLSDLPSEFPEALKGNFRRIEPTVIKRATGLKQKFAKAALSSALKKFAPRADGRLSLETALNADELAVLQCSLHNIKAEPLYTDDNLYRGFCGALEKNDLLSPAERPRMKAVKPGIILYAIAHMHLTEIVCNVDIRAILLATNNDGKLDVWAKSEYPKNDTETIYVCVPFFSTDLNTKDWVNPNLFDDGISCSKPIEVTNEVTNKLKLVVF